MRYEYEHAILGYDESSWEGTPLEPGHRLSIMVRVSATLRVEKTAEMTGCAEKTGIMSW